MTGLLTGYIDWWRKRFILAATLKFFGCLAIGFALGVYFLPIIIADGPADQTVLADERQSADRQAVFVRNLPGSDAFHWGEGTLLVSKERVTLMGEVSPGPDYRLYLTPEYTETKEGFLAIKAQSREIARIKGFKDFSYPIDRNIDLGQYDSVLIWCERFGAFITSGRLTSRP